MDIELIEIREFLLAHPPFDRLDHDALGRLQRHITIRYLRRGAEFPPPRSTEPFSYLVRQGAIELRDALDQLLGLLCEGDLYFDACTADDMHLAVNAHTREDTLLYQFPCRFIELLRTENSSFDQFFSHSLTERLQHALRTLQEEHGSGLLTVRCADLIQRSPVVTPPETTIREAAQLMTAQNISALLIASDDKVEGIVTDRDLRTRCLAVGISPDAPVRTIMTTPLETLSAASTGYEALLAMTRRGVHHLPIVAKTQTIGMLTATDLFRHQSFNVVHLVGAIRRSANVEAVIAQARLLPELQRHLMASGATGRDLGKAMAAVTDALTVKLLALAEDQLGEPPVPYTWLVFGSQARQEQTAHTDQDNGLLIDDGYIPAHAPYFEALSRFVTAALDQCGISFCNGDVMASNPRWRQPLAQWQNYFTDWVEQPDPRALMHVSIFFDLRALHGTTALADKLRSHILSLTRGNTLFLAYLTANALHHRPPLGFFRQFVLIKGGEHDAMLDVKLQGIIPVVDLARVQTLAAGMPTLNTHERLKAALDEQILSSEAVDNLLDVLDLLLTLRARHQAEQIRLGKAPDNFLAPHQLSPLERRHLKDAFAVIAALQSTLSQRYQSERFG
ncbi:MAG TPA: DUF294 nucleotidyltransferase-like domain-containing protein [Gammaproteobacteria bacterium]